MPRRVLARARSRARARATCAIPPSSAAPRSRFRAITAAIPPFAPSGGTSRAGCASARARLRRPGHVLPHAPGRRRRQRSRFAPTQLLFAHAAIADPALGRLRHDQRAARAGFGLAQASESHDRRARSAIGRCALPATRYAAQRRRARLRVRPRVRAATAAAARRARREPQGSAPTRRRASITAGRSSRRAAR